MQFKTRRKIAAALCLIVYLPLLPFAALMVGAKAVHDVIDWAFDGRWLARQVQAICNKIEKAFGVDAESEWAEMRARRGKVTATKS